MGLRRSMLFTLGAKIKNLILIFKARVLNDAGLFEAESCLENQLNNIGSALFQEASLVITPNAVKTSKLYAVKQEDGSGDLTVTRATTATRVNASGIREVVPANTARIDYSTGNGMILVEPQRTNLLLRSEEFENSYWFKTGGTLTTNVTTAPDGTLTAELWTKTGAINTVNGVVKSPFTFPSTGIYTLSCYYKQNVGDTFFIRLDRSGNTCNAQFNFTTKTFTNTGANFISSSYEELPNGWFRLILVGNVTATNWSLDIVNLFGNPTNDSVYVWGAQLEQGSNATSYIPTTSATVTRNADVINKTGISSLIGQTEGTLYWHGLIKQAGSTLIGLRESSGIVSRVLIDIDANYLYGYIAENNIVRARIKSLNQFNINSICKVAYVYKSGQLALFINGVKQGASNYNYNFNNSIESVNLINGYNFGSTSQSSMYNSIIFKKALTDAEAIQLTTL